MSTIIQRAVAARTQLARPLYFPLGKRAVSVPLDLEVGLTVLLGVREALMKDHTPVPLSESVLPTAYRAESNAVFMVQKIRRQGQRVMRTDLRQ